MVFLPKNSALTARYAIRATRVGVDATGGNQIAAVACHDVQIGCGLADVEMVGIKLANGFCPLDVLGHFFLPF